MECTNGRDQDVKIGRKGEKSRSARTPTKETDESPTTFALEAAPREQLPVVIYPRCEVRIRVGVRGPDERERGGKEDISCYRQKTNRCSVELTSARGNFRDRIRRRHPPVSGIPSCSRQTWPSGSKSMTQKLGEILRLMITY